MLSLAAAVISLLLVVAGVVGLRNTQKMDPLPNDLYYSTCIFLILAGLALGAMIVFLRFL